MELLRCLTAYARLDTACCFVIRIMDNDVAQSLSSSLILEIEALMFHRGPS